MSKTLTESMRGLLNLLEEDKLIKEETRTVTEKDDELDETSDSDEDLDESKDDDDELDETSDESDKDEDLDESNTSRWRRDLDALYHILGEGEMNQDEEQDEDLDEDLDEDDEIDEMSSGPSEKFRSRRRETEDKPYDATAGSQDEIQSHRDKLAQKLKR